jgi:hypothetical protein
VRGLTALQSTACEIVENVNPVSRSFESAHASSRRFQILKLS